MEFNALYDCKIKLFGNPVKHIKHNPNAVFLKILNLSCYIERKEFIKVGTLNNDIYYIPKSDIDTIKNEFYFEITRKDIIQVNSVLHADCMKDNECIK